MALLQDLVKRQPQGETQQQLIADHQRLNSARLQAADKLLAIAQDQQVQMAVIQVKLNAMRALAQLGDPQMQNALREYCRSLVGNPDKELATTGRLMVFGLDVDALPTGKAEDVPPVLQQLKQLVADIPDDSRVFTMAGQAAVMLQQKGYDDAALEAYRVLGNAFKDSPEPLLAAQAHAMLQRAQTIEVDLNGKLDAMFGGQPNSVQPVMDAIESLLGAESPGSDLLEMLSQVSQLLEISGHYAEASQALALIEKAYQANPDESLGKQAAAQAENGRRRAALIGQPLAVEGVLADGSPFDWSQYQGKVILIDFWATWCGPCLQEIPHMQRNYEAYRDKGFEVVGVNLDDDPAAMKQFLSAQPLPWTTVVSADPNAKGFDNPLAVKCGVDAIPFMLLVGRDGNVHALHVRGEKLDAKLAELLGQ